MYRGKQPAYVISILVGALVIISGLLWVLTRGGESALTGSTVIHPPEEQSSPESPSLVDTGSARVLFDATGKTFVDFTAGEEIQVGEHQLKVMGIRAMDKIGVYLTPEQFRGTTAEKVFYVVQLQITNLGVKEGYAPVEMFHLSDGQYEYSLDEKATAFFEAESIQYAVLRHNVKRNVKMAFDVDPGVYVLHISGDDGTIYRMNMEEI